jgi:hypothetical protein
MRGRPGTKDTGSWTCELNKYALPLDRVPSVLTTLEPLRSQLYEISTLQGGDTVRYASKPRHPLVWSLLSCTHATSSLRASFIRLKN